MDPFQTDEDGGGTVFRDVILLALAGFVVILFIVLGHINPPTVEASLEEIESPGSVVVEATWQPGLDADVDLWVKAPGDMPVGYSNKGGIYFNLLRDDLGKKADSTDINYEVSFTRGMPDGEYIVNLHMYSNRTNNWPIIVDVWASRKQSANGPIKKIFQTRVSLKQQAEEITAFRFRMLRGELEPESITFVPIGLRSMKFR